MPAKKNTQATWAAIRQHLNGWEPDALIALLKDRHDSSATNRDFLHARVTAAQGGDASFASYHMPHQTHDRAWWHPPHFSPALYKHPIWSKRVVVTY